MAAFALTSTAFKEGETIPKQYTGDGQNLSPPFAWTEPPAGARGFALICEDPDAPRRTFTHWVIFHLPADARQLSEGLAKSATLPAGAVHGVNDFGKIGYGGPAPPPGKPHRYFFKLFALDQPLSLDAGATKDQLLGAMKGHIVAEASLMGVYER
jgi:Raf kinase inhibitor-like YbhB/YbcL family protein